MAKCGARKKFVGYAPCEEWVGGDNTCRVCAVCDSSVPGASAPAPVVFLHNATGNPAPVHGDEPPHVELVLVFRPGVRPMYTISVPVHDMGKTLNISLQSLFEHTTGLWELVLTLGVLSWRCAPK